MLDCEVVRSDFEEGERLKKKKKKMGSLQKEAQMSTVATPSFGGGNNRIAAVNTVERTTLANAVKPQTTTHQVVDEL